MYVQGMVREWLGEEGWGVIEAPETPGGCWTHFSVIVMPGYHELVEGRRVTFTFEKTTQDGFAYRATRVWPPGVRPGTSPQPPSEAGSDAYRSTLTIRYPDGTTTVRDGPAEK
jgi:CspA family cold shock protein